VVEYITLCLLLPEAGDKEITDDLVAELIPNCVPQHEVIFLTSRNERLKIVLDTSPGKIATSVMEGNGKAGRIEAKRAFLASEDEHPHGNMI